MEMRDQSKVINELRSGPGQTVEERTDAVLSRRGWDKHLAAIKDADFRGLVRCALEHLALPGRDPRSARDIEKARHDRETQKLADSGVCRDLFMDKVVGVPADKLVCQLPRETYWVESLGRHVPRNELASELEAVAELRRAAAEGLSKIEKIADVYRYELAIFDELLRQGMDRRPAKTEAAYVQ